MGEYGTEDSANQRNREGIEQDKKSGHVQVNPYWFQKHFVGESLEFLTKAFDILNEGNWDKSEIQADYFDVGWYVSVNIGEYDKPYKYTGIENKTLENSLDKAYQPKLGFEEGVEKMYGFAPEELATMSISDLAMIVYDDWKSVNYAAKPYLQAMSSLNSVKDNYGMDSGYSIIAYFLSNASQWKGEVAKGVKAELKKRLKRG